MLITFLDNYVNNFWCPNIYEFSAQTCILFKTVYLTVTCEPVLDIKDDPLKFWKDNVAEYPRLAKLANKYLAIVERLFKVFSPDMCRLKDETFVKD